MPTFLNLINIWVFTYKILFGRRPVDFKEISEEFAHSQNILSLELKATMELKALETYACIYAKNFPNQSLSSWDY